MFSEEVGLVLPKQIIMQLHEFLFLLNFLLLLKIRAAHKQNTVSDLRI